MKILIVATSVVIILISACNTNRDKETYLTLQGDWSAGFERTFMFKDSLCNYLYPFGNFTRFRVKDDTIICKTKYPDSRRFKEIKFHILRLDEDSLHIEYRDFHTKKKEQVFFCRTKNKLGSNIRVDSVIYLMGWDSESRHLPSRYIKFLNDSTIFIKNNNDYPYLYKKSDDIFYSIPKNYFEFINDKFSNIDYKLIEKYSSEYSNYYDIAEPQVSIYVKNESTNFKKTFSIYNLYKFGCMVDEDNYPVELKIFMSYLDNIDYFLK